MLRWKRLFTSYRAKLQVSLLTLGLLTIGASYWQASKGAAAALTRNTHDRLTSIRETKRSVVEDFFRDLEARILALSTDESAIVALEEFRKNWNSLPEVNAGTADFEALRRVYSEANSQVIDGKANLPRFLAEWFPQEARTRGAQLLYVAQNPHLANSRGLLLTAPTSAAYNEVHARFHPTFYRYLNAFDLYDIFLIDAQTGRIVYTVSKEIDFGMRLTEPPYGDSTLAGAFKQALTLREANRAVITDYAPYMPSYLAPAAFIAAPIWRAGVKIGVIAAQVSIERVNRLMTGDRRWHEEGFGNTGQAYIVGEDLTLRSDLRFEIENPEGFLARLGSGGLPDAVSERIRRNRTAILNLRMPPDVATSGEGRNLLNEEVIRSHGALNIPGVKWTLIAEMETQEAFEPIASLRHRLLGTGLFITLLFVGASWLLARSVTGPVLALVEGARRLGGRDFDVRLTSKSADEIGQLADSFNNMIERLKSTTVSRDDLDRVNHELKELTSRLIHAQEEERARLARELHDDVTQRIAAVAIAVGTLKRRERLEAADAQPRLQEIQGQLVELSEDVHRLSRRLHSKTLEDLKLIAALEGECRGFFERTGIPVEFRHTPELDALPADKQLALYRIVQEGLRNIARHADAAEVDLLVEQQDDVLTLKLNDDGRGFDRSAPEWQPGLGLASMGERARLIGGTMLVTSAPGKGTRLFVEVPTGYKE